MLEGLWVLVDKTKGVEYHQGDLDACWQDYQGVVQADEGAIWVQTSGSFDSVTDATHGHREDTEWDESADGIQPDGDLEFVEDGTHLDSWILVEGGGEEEAGPDWD